jgi:hypothetical protein
MTRSRVIRAMYADDVRLSFLGAMRRFRRLATLDR